MNLEIEQTIILKTFKYIKLQKTATIEEYRAVKNKKISNRQIIKIVAIYTHVTTNMLVAY